MECISGRISWDFVIYFVVTGGVVLFGNIVRLGGRIRKILAVTIVQALELLAVSYLVILPFTIQFDSMVDGVGDSQISQLFLSAPCFVGDSCVACSCICGFTFKGKAEAGGA